MSQEEGMKIQRAAPILFSLVLLLAMLIPLYSIAEIYKWVDEEGIVHFTNEIDEVPLQYRPDRISTKPSPRKPQTSSSQKEWKSMTHEEKVEHLRRLKEKKAEEERKIAGYPEPIQQLVRDHRLKAGMTKEMVLLSWGDPVEIRPRSPKNAQEKWIYAASQPDKSSCAYFENDILTAWEE